MYQSFEENKKYMDEMLHVNECFDIVSRTVLVGDKNAVFYFVDGFLSGQTVCDLMYRTILRL